LDDCHEFSDLILISLMLVVKIHHLLYFIMIKIASFFDLFSFCFLSLCLHHDLIFLIHELAIYSLKLLFLHIVQLVVFYLTFEVIHLSFQLLVESH
jgi:hypothetical protein